MKIPSPIFVGYFPKIVAQKNDLRMENSEIWLKNDTVKEICSVSDCISKGPEKWIDQWKHNDLGFYDTEGIALSVIPEDADSTKYELFGYKIYPIKFDERKSLDYLVEVQAQENLSSYEMIGFDAVSKSISDFFECSALSCTNACAIFPVNRYCLIKSLEEAFQCCKIVSDDTGKWEPGPYYLFQVFRRKNKN